jgi:hypothetical protein
MLVSTLFKKLEKISFSYTVKLVLRDLPRDIRKKVTYDRWSLNSGGLFSEDKRN